MGPTQLSDVTFDKKLGPFYPLKLMGQEVALISQQVFQLSEKFWRIQKEKTAEVTLVNLPKKLYRIFSASDFESDYMHLLNFDFYLNYFKLSSTCSIYLI